MGSVVFDGVDDKAIAASVPVAGSGANHSFSIGVVFKVNTDEAHDLAGLSDNTGDDHHMVAWRADTDSVFVQSRTTGNSTANVAAAPNTWHYAIGAWSRPATTFWGAPSGQYRGMVNNGGTEDFSNVDRAAAFNEFSVGWSASSARGFFLDGKIAYVFVWDKVLTAQEVDDWVAGTIVAEANLVAWWDFTVEPSGGVIPSEVGTNDLTLTGTTFDAADTPTVTYGSGGAAVLGTAVLAGGGSLASSGKRLVLGSGSLAGVGALSATGRRSVFGTGSLSGIGSLTASGLRRVLGAVALAGDGQLVALGTVSSGGATIIGTASLLGDGSLEALGKRIVLGSGSLAGVGTLASNGMRVVLGVVSLPGGGILTSVGGLPVVLVAPHVPRGRNPRSLFSYHPYSPRRETSTGFAWPVVRTDGKTIHAVKQIVIQVPYEQRVVDAGGVEYRLLPSGLVEPL